MQSIAIDELMLVEDVAVAYNVLRNNIAESRIFDINHIDESG